MDPGLCAGTLSFLVRPKSSGCSMKAFLSGCPNCRFIASKAKSARILPSSAFLRRSPAFQVKPLKHSEDLRGNGPSSFAQGARLKVEHGGVMTKASASPASINCSHFHCTAGCVQSAFRLCRRSTSSTSTTQ